MYILLFALAFDVALWIYEGAGLPFSSSLVSER
jgi:hypothetical protein